MVEKGLRKGQEKEDDTHPGRHEFPERRLSGRTFKQRIPEHGIKYDTGT